MCSHHHERVKTMANEQSSNESSHAGDTQSTKPGGDNAANNSSNNVSDSAASAPGDSHTTAAPSHVTNEPLNTASDSDNNTINTELFESNDQQAAGQGRSSPVRRPSLSNRQTQIDVLVALEAAYASGFLDDSDLRLEDDSSDEEGGF